MTKSKGIRLSLWLSLSVYWLITFLLLVVAVRGMSGHFGYPLDDTYIHMAIAKHLAIDGTWGVSQNGFSSSTSSPLWTLLITLTYKIFGVNDWSPLALSALFGSIIVCVCYFVLRNFSNPVRLPLLLIIIIMFVPLPVLTLTGMEHTLHGLLTLLLVYCAATYLTKDGFDARLFLLLILLANLLTVTRYEGVLLVFSVVLLCIFKRRFREGILFGVCSLLLVTAYGCLSLANGWHFLPNPILLKGNMPSLTLEGLSVLLNRMVMNFYSSPHVIVLLIACLFLYLWLGNQFGSKEKSLVILVTLISFLHMQFARTGWFFRYESYLVLVLSVALFDAINKSAQLFEAINGNTEHYLVGLMLLIVICIPLTTRTSLALKEYPVAVRNIYEQQYQMGLFVRTYYAGNHVAANDIGAINYLADIHTLDLYGLANLDVLQHALDNSFDKESMNQLVSDQNVSLVAIYDSWFIGNIPDSWVQVGKWKISNNVVCGSDEVSFYAPNDSLKQDLFNNLAEFSGTLPSTVAQSGVYVSP